MSGEATLPAGLVPPPTIKLGTRYEYQRTTGRFDQGEPFPLTLRWDTDFPFHSPDIVGPAEEALLAIVEAQRAASTKWDAADLADTFCYIRRHRHEDSSCRRSIDEAERVVTLLGLRRPAAVREPVDPARRTDQPRRLAAALHALHTTHRPRHLAGWDVACGWGWAEPGEPSDCAHLAAAIEHVRLAADPEPTEAGRP